MNTLLGIIIICIGSFGQSSSYVPLTKIKSWSWESFWLVQGLFAFVLFPYLGAQLAVPEGHSLFEILFAEKEVAIKALSYGLLWGVGGLTFGLSMRYLGVALGQSIALGTCSAFGTLLPALIKGTDLFTGKGLILLISVSVAIAGISVIGYAGSLRSKSMSMEQKLAAVKDFALGKGLLIALVAGVMSACFSLGIDAAEPIKTAAIRLGAKPIFAELPVIFIIASGGFITNALYCLVENVKNDTLKDYFSIPKNIFFRNILLCLLAGVLWYSQLFCFVLGKSYLMVGSVMMAFSWSILMSMNVAFSNVWGIILKEWRGASVKTVSVLILGMFILVFSLLIPNFFGN